MTSTRDIDRLAYAHDASHFLLVPDAVEVAENLDQIAALLTSKKPMTFRSGGTSLSGQASTDSLLIDTRKNFKKIEILDNGARVRVQPGLTVREVNARLARYGYKLGPDPASEAACTIGGVIANNSSGMVCGTEFNTYQTLESLVVVLPSGTRIDTSAVDADQKLRALEPDLYTGIVRLRDRIRSNPSSLERISKLFAIKNTMGYGINSFVDYTDPIDIFLHLMVGSEGTLGFIAEAVFRTVPLKPHIATGFLVFDSLKEATATLPELVASGLSAIELLDQQSLRVAQSDPKATDLLRGLKVDNHAGLLIEYQEMSADALGARVANAEATFAGLRLSSAAKERSDLWHIRKGLYATVAGNRPSGTTALLEDIAVPVPSLAGTCESLLELFAKHEYKESVIFGHAKDGNIHFLLNEDFTNSSDTARYARFTDEMVELVLANEGTLKAEHGTGRVMAPFVRRQYGDELYEVMKEIKALFDPRGVLNPGAVLSDDSDIHLKNLKTSPTVEREVDRCVECGYCEPVCPSKNLTLTPRQRIVIRREMQRATDSGNIALYKSLAKEYDYASVDTCAVDGMCQTACPVLINTGDLVRRLREEQAKPAEKILWSVLAKRWGLATKAIATGLNVGGFIKGLPKGGSVRQPIYSQSADAVYFPSCTSAMFESKTTQSLLSLAARAGVDLVTPEGIEGLCCTTPWKSKGFRSGYVSMQSELEEWVMRATDGGRIPLISDASSCTDGLTIALAKHPEVKVIDSLEFVATQILPKVNVSKKIHSMALHPTCSSTQLGLNDALVAIAKACADEVVIPDDWSCCGFAGDRGITHPELTASATAPAAANLSGRTFDAYGSCNRTCEIGMSRATGQEYRHVVDILAQLAL